MGKIYSQDNVRDYIGGRHLDFRTEGMVCYTGTELLREETGDTGTCFTFSFVIDPTKYPVDNYIIYKLFNFIKNYGMNVKSFQNHTLRVRVGNIRLKWGRADGGYFYTNLKEWMTPEEQKVFSTYYTGEDIMLGTIFDVRISNIEPLHTAMNIPIYTEWS